ncbi:MAK10-like protein [Tanacetum coccineum]
MGDANLILTLGDYSKPGHEGYRNTIELPVGNNVVPFRSDTIRLVQNKCSFHGLWSEDPNQHLNDFLKLVDSHDLDSANRERMRLCLFQFSLRDQASNWLECLLVGSITIWEDLTTRFLAQFFPPRRTVKLRNDILMFQQHQGESLSEAWIRFKDLLQKFSHYGIDRWLQIQIFYDHVSFHLKCEIDCAACGKLCDKNADESWKIIENLALYDHESWNDSKNFIKPVKAISTPQSTSKTPDRRLLKLEDQFNFLLKGSRLTPRPSSMHVPQAYAKAVYSNPRQQNQNEPPKQNPFTFVNLEEISDRMDKMFGLLKELTTSRAPKKEEKSDKDNVSTSDDIEKTNGSDTKMLVKEAKTKNDAKKKIQNEPIKRDEKEKGVEAPNSQPIEYYLKHRINEKLIMGLVDNHRFNDSLLGVRVGKMKGKTYTLSPKGPVYEAILKKQITRKEDIGGIFEIPCNIGALKNMNALVDQGSNVNVMPLSTYMKLTDKRPAKTDIRLSLASYSYIYPLGIAEDVLVDVTGFVYPVDFMILDIKEDEKRPFILGTPFLTTAKAVIKFDKGTITLRSGKSKISFHRIPESLCKAEKGIKNNIRPIAPIVTINRIILEWEERIKLHREKEMKFEQWRSKNLKNERPVLVKVENEMDDEGEVT